MNQKSITKKDLEGFENLQGLKRKNPKGFRNP
jgi:hypothetical protein